MCCYDGYDDQRDHGFHGTGEWYGGRMDTSTQNGLKCNGRTLWVGEPSMFAGMDPASISVVIITRNESANIDRCLQSVAWADEIVVVDSESTDDTVERCKGHGARVVSRPFTGFGAQKNAALDLAGCTWVFSIDADEVVSEELARSIRHAVEHPTADAYQVRRRFFFLGKRLGHGRGSVDTIVRLVRRGTARFSDALVHEGFEIRGVPAVLDGEMEHYSYDTINQVLEKFNRYTSLAAVEMRANNRRRSVVGTLLAWPVYFLKFYLLHGQWMNGLHGLVWSVLSSWYPFVKVAKARLDR
ncbi:MAG: glycosyltransferase family 2 protein [Candidatus Kapabacteria bacterium]|nr:glycosyltransferase family 2 protein [Candidatus Kapabacteria bacterium]